jgi:hypothetical protein
MRIPALIVAAFLAASAVASAATPAPKASAPVRVNVQQLQPKEIFPKKKLHVEVMVEINKYGQVARVRSIKPSHDEQFDAHAYGNALQAFIRTPDGHVVLGSYRLTYDYDPTTQAVKRDVALVKTGGVNPNAKGAANDMMEIARRNRNRTPPPAAVATPGVTPAVNPAPSVRRMPDLPQVMKTPSP